MIKWVLTPLLFVGLGVAAYFLFFRKAPALAAPVLASKPSTPVKQAVPVATPNTPTTVQKAAIQKANTVNRSMGLIPKGKR